MNFDDMNAELLMNQELQRISSCFNIGIDAAFEVISIASYLQITYDEANWDVRIIGQERGIDGVYFQNERLRCNMTIFQCKNKSHIKENELTKLKTDVQGFFHTETNDEQEREFCGLKKSIDRYKQISEEDGKVIKEKFVFSFNGDKTIGKEKDFVKKYTNSKFVIWDRNDILKIINSGIIDKKEINYTFSPEKSNIQQLLATSQDMVSFEAKEIRTLMFRLKAKHLCGLLKNYEEAYGNYTSVFSDNIREFLGSKNPANSLILNTINSTDNSYFPLLNNGVTIICKQIEIPDNPQKGIYKISTINPVIINGLQTTSVIYNKYLESQDSIESIFITVKLIETDDKYLIDLITEATNTQTPITFKDRISNKKFNINTKKFFSIHGVNYVTKSSELFPKEYESLKLSVSSELVFNIWLATFYEKPEMFLKDHIENMDLIYIIQSDTEHLFHGLYNGTENSPLHSQLYLCFMIYHNYKKIKTKLNVDDEVEGLLFYGVYKEIERDIESLSNEKIIDLIKKVNEVISINVEQEKKIQQKLTLSYYFGHTKSRSDLNKSIGVEFQSNLEIMNRIKDYEIKTESIFP